MGYMCMRDERMGSRLEYLSLASGPRRATFPASHEWGECTHMISFSRRESPSPHGWWRSVISLSPLHSFSKNWTFRSILRQPRELKTVYLVYHPLYTPLAHTR